MTSQGSAIPTFQQALIDALVALEPNVVAYESPMSLSAALGKDGSGESVFWLDDLETSYDLNVIHGPGHLRIDEAVNMTLVIQCVGRTTDHTQHTLDTRAAEIQYSVASLLASDPNQLIGDTADLHIVRGLMAGSGTWQKGIDSQNQRGVRIELPVMLEARIVSTA